MSRARASGRSAEAPSGANPRSRAERAAHYRHYADQFRVLADDALSQPQRAELAKLARRYAQLAALLSQPQRTGVAKLTRRYAQLAARNRTKL
jgi:hypothetical protein